MPDKPVGGEEKMKEVFEISKKYSQMPLAERLSELKKLKQKKKELEGRLESADTEILVLETMPDITEQKVMNDRLSIAVLEYFRDGGLYKDLMKRDCYSLISSRIYLLKNAGLVEIERNSPDFPKIKLTERGRSLQYKEQTG